MKQLLKQIQGLFLLALNWNRLGTIQQKWIFSLIIHPERQLRNDLGRKFKDGSYKACCLGEAGLIAGVCKWEEVKDYYPLIEDRPDGSARLLYNTYKEIGLHSYNGKGKDGSLARLNDTGKTWPEIALIILKDIKGYLAEKK